VHLVVFALLMMVLLGVVGLGTPVLLTWLTGVWGFMLFGVVVFVSVAMHFAAVVAAYAAEDVIVLWRGEETACAVLDEQRVEEHVSGGTQSTKRSTMNWCSTARHRTRPSVSSRRSRPRGSASRFVTRLRAVTR
jgi:hypothetical protein